MYSWLSLSPAFIRNSINTWVLVYARLQFQNESLDELSNSFKHGRREEDKSSCADFSTLFWSSAICLKRPEARCGKDKHEKRPLKRARWRFWGGVHAVFPRLLLTWPCWGRWEVVMLTDLFTRFHWIRFVTLHDEQRWFAGRTAGRESPGPWLIRLVIYVLIVWPVNRNWVKIFAARALDSRKYLMDIYIYSHD